jgi:glucosamine kinase
MDRPSASPAHPRAPLLLGIDAGGTAVSAVLAEPDGTVIGAGHAGAGNPVALPLETVTGHVAEAVTEAIGDAEPSRVAAAVLGVAGVARFTRPDGTRALHRAWREAGLRCEVRVVADPVVAFAAGTPARRGAVLIGGTGTIAAAIDETEVTSRVDGHGWLVGDDGSGFWLGRQAVRAVLSELDGRGEPTMLRYAVLATMTGCDELPPTAAQQVDLLRGAVYDGPPISLARLAALVPAAADAGDRVAQRIVDRAVALLMDTVEGLLAGGPAGPAGVPAGVAAGRVSDGPADEATGARPPVSPSSPLVLAGSVLTSPGPIQREVRRRITGRYGSGPLVAGPGEGGAAWLAARQLSIRQSGTEPGAGVHESLTAAVPSRSLTWG